MPPFDKINYMLRPNKNVERKLIIESLAALTPRFDLTTYRYIGFGSMWFVDFVLMHKYLQIQKMYSIEKPAYATRAEFNKPYGCITVIDADSSVALPIMELNSDRSIVWLDYEDGLDGPMLEDIKVVCESAKSGTVLIVTANASLGRLLNMYREDENKKPLNAKDIVRRLGGTLIPQTLPKHALIKRKDGFPSFLAEILFTHAKRVGRISGGEERFHPFFNFFYQDGSPMITIGGMIANEEDKKLMDQCKLFEKFSYLKQENQSIIDIPPLTTKEKSTLDLLLPSKVPPTVEEISQKGFRLAQAQIDSYHKFYRYYPTFGELAV